MSLDPERGGDTVADPKALRFTPPPDTDPAELDKAYINFVERIIARKKKGANDIRMVAIDSIDELISLFQRALCLQTGAEDVGDVDGGHGKGYAIVRERVFGMLDMLYRAGLGWAIIAHTAEKTIQVGKETRQISGLAVSDSYKRAIFQKCEHMVFIEKGVITVKGEDEVKVVKGKTLRKPGATTTQHVRKLKTSPGGLWQGGDTNDVKVRVPLQEELVLPEVGGWDVFTKAYEDAIALLTKEKQNVG